MDRSISFARSQHVKGNRHDPHAPIGTFGPNGDPLRQLSYLNGGGPVVKHTAPDLLQLVEALHPLAPDWVKRELNIRLPALSLSATTPPTERLDVRAWCSILAGLDRGIANGPCGHFEDPELKGAST